MTNILDVKFGTTIYSIYIRVMKTSLNDHDKKVIRDIVSHTSEGERVHLLRRVFGKDCSFEHFMFLGEEIAFEKFKQKDNQNWLLISRMKALAIN